EPILERFFKAADESNVEDLTALLDQDPKLISVVDEIRGWTALHYARQPLAVKLLLSRGADPKATDWGGVTPLHLAKDIVSAELLMLAGGDPEAEDSDGFSPLSWAFQHQQNLIFEMLARDQFNYHFLRLSMPDRVQATYQGETHVFLPESVGRENCEAHKDSPGTPGPFNYEVSRLQDLRHFAS
ncbi:MAG: ankyrin repeat domain-containing protein, partial [Candidatus Eremiobacteraeota bacterium]|nr:ankyrin repeat domain-containing protein [Candidatus Eremiobacteraeota bacterium]